MRNLHYLLLAVCGILLAGCSQEEEIDRSRPTNPIKFSAGFTSRGTEITLANLYGFVVTAYNNGTTGHKAVNGVYPDPYFEDEPFIGNNTQYSSLTGKDWPKNDDPVEFFAYYPQLSVLRKNFASYDYLQGINAADSTFIKMYNMCGDDGKEDPIDLEEGVTSIFQFDDNELLPGFKLGRFYVPKDISQHVDFITAHQMGNKGVNEMSGLRLNFHHQLAQVELRGINNSTFYTVDVAGVHLSNPMVAGAMFNFCNETGELSDKEGGHWEIATNPMYSEVEYIYQPANPDTKQPADNILRLQPNAPLVSGDNTPADDYARGTSLMGNGGNAMVLPTVRPVWAHIDDPTNENKNMYIGVLMNVKTIETNGAEAVQLYPPLNSAKAEGLRIVSFVVDKESQAIQMRVYKDATGRYYETPDFSGNPVNLHVEEIIDQETNQVTETVVTEEFKDFAWGAVPVAVSWELGNKYVYTLDYSSGVGVRTPLDPDPGTPILGGNIQLFVEVSGWDTHYDSTVPVPSE